ncbi:MAG: 50S ribosomal protein L29 [Candidatus Wildermuthbacteria bacterium RIFCSPHIGHO2_02_FULL_48_16]|uniref:Large ribosomal subunit protein uL29 n=1 Tax=Candidatus Wildermuthbacteria bacterium RIFCSPHIGHO2_02_FULL_48_16 TaxID=1802453 RepID=A0A1G2R7A3_9BACT|nr:MAG: 50S ribosomal protein L29 [Candidatus Wildermuthbacteria bacterium RIFCSPHIGHO2_02_FULL_48_16]
MKIAELRQKQKPELQDLLRSAKVKLQQLRFDLSSGKLKNVKEIMNTKRYIAQLITICPKENLQEK